MPILVEEVRLGLFRLYWDLSNITWHEEDPVKVQFKLCGSKKGRAFLFTLLRQFAAKKKYDYKISIKDFLCSNDSSYSSESDSSEDSSDESTSQSKQEQPQLKRQKLNESAMPSKVLENEFPIYIWLDGFVSSTKNLPLLAVADGIWEADMIGKEIQRYFVVWMNFGTSEIKQKHVINGLAEMFHNQTQCDVQFEFNDGQSIGAHVVILSAGSPVFAAMFQSDFVESKSRKVTIVDVEIDVFKQFLMFLYTGTAPRLNDESVARLLFELADKYGAGVLKEECVDVLLTHIGMENVIDMLVWANFHSIEKLSKKTMKFLVKNFRKLCVQPEWMELMKNHLDLCLQVNKEIAELLPETESKDAEKPSGKSKTLTKARTKEAEHQRGWDTMFETGFRSPVWEVSFQRFNCDL